MKLRFFEVYNKDGLTIESGLQFWDDECLQWTYVNSIRVSEKERDEAQRDGNYF